MSFVCFNGEFLPADQPLFTSANRSFKFGDGLFETIKVFKGVVLFQNFHFERLFLGLQMLRINLPAELTSAALISQIISLCEKNNCSDLGRVRLAAYRNDDNLCEYCIEACAVAPAVHQWRANLRIDLFPYSRKTMDAYAGLKSANFLPYVMAARFAEEKDLDDCILLNADNHLCETSKANIFLVKNGELFTPSLDQGCVSGVMRRFLIEELKRRDYIVYQKPLKEEDLQAADEIFITNAIIGMKGVKAFRDRLYTSSLSAEIYNQVLAPMYGE